MPRTFLDHAGKPALWVSRALFGIAFLWGACLPKPPVRISVPEMEKKKILKEASAALGRRPIERVKALARVKIKIRSSRQSFDAAIFVDFGSPPRKKTRFRFEILDDFGKIHLLVFSDGEKLFWDDATAGKRSELELSEKNIARFLPFFSSIEESLALLFGVDARWDLEEASVFRGEEPEQYLIVFSKGELTWNRSSQEFSRLALKNAQGRPLISSVLGNYENPGRKQSGRNFPLHLFLKDLKNKNELELNYLSLEIDPQAPFPPMLFEAIDSF